MESWEWATSPWFDVRPLWFERHNDLPGRRLKAVPKRTDNRTEVGLGRDDIVWVERNHTKFGPYETLFRWEKSAVESVRYHFHAQDPINWIRCSFIEGRATESLLVAEMGWIREVYEYSKHRLTAVHVEHAPRNANHFLPLQPLHVAIPCYDADDALERIELHWPPDPPGRPESVVEIAFLRADA